MNVMPIVLAIFAALLPSTVFVGALLSSMIATKAGMKERGEACERTSGACDCGDEQSQSSSTDSSDYDPEEAARRLAAHPWWGMR